MSLMRPALKLFILLTLLTGVAYPLAVTGVGQLAFPAKANGSPIERDGRVVGSSLIGQPFADAKHFWSRPSATAPTAYNASASSGSNLGPTNPALHEAIAGRLGSLRKAGTTELVPVDLVTASGSGLDPHISVAGALYQIERVAGARRLPKERVNALVVAHTEGRALGLFGEPRVNVLALNLDLESVATSSVVDSRR